MTGFSRLIRRIFGLYDIHIERNVSHDEIFSLVSMLRASSPQMPLIRVGAQNDGGYLIPDDLQGVNYVFSPGVGKKSAFELDLVNKGLSAFLCDYSVPQPPTSHPRFHFVPKFIGVVNNQQEMTLRDWIDEAVGNKSSDLILQMDIEGSEYHALLSTPIETLCRFRIVIVEFHFLELMGSRLGYDLILSTFRHLLSKFTIVHTHPNNCCRTVKISGVNIHPVVEITFLRNDRIRSAHPNKQCRHALDQDCIPSRDKIYLAKEWYWH